MRDEWWGGSGLEPPGNSTKLVGVGSSAESFC